MLGAALFALAVVVPAQGSPRGAATAFDFPDPTVFRVGEGYVAFATQGSRDGRMVNIQVAASRDLKRWRALPDALPVKPAWASRTQDFWAPDVARIGDRWVMHYSAKPDAALDDKERGLCLAVATADKPAGPYSDVGAPLLCGSGFVNIDPQAYRDPATGKWLLYWGSGFGPIKVRELTADGLRFKDGAPTVDLVDVVKTDDPRNYRRLVEGAWVVKRGGWYYLFFSGDNCCGKNAHYAALVARSRSATGPFEVRERPVVEADARWLAPGHNSVFTDARGRDWIAYHAIDRRRPRAKPTDEVNSRRVMLLGRLEWRDGWPVVRP